MSVHKLKDGRLFCKWQEDGKEKRKYFGFGDIAEHQARRFDEEIKRQRGKIKIEGGLSVTEVCQLYHLQHPVQDSTSKTDVYRLTRVILPRLGELQVETMSTQHINEYILKRIKEGRKRRTIDREIDILKAAFNWAQNQDPSLIMRNPLANFRMTGMDDAEVPFPPSKEELQRIISHAPHHLIRALLTEWHFGLRPGGEVSRIKWGDVDFTSNKIRVISARKGGPVTRYIPIKSSENNMFRNYLLDWKEQDAIKLGDDGNLFDIPVVHYGLKPVLSMKRSWATAKRKAGITRRLRLYDLRHAMATYALEAGADLKALSQILGHSRPDTTLRFYQHVLDSQHRDVVEKIPDLQLYHVSITKKPAVAIKTL